MFLVMAGFILVLFTGACFGALYTAAQSPLSLLDLTDKAGTLIAGLLALIGAALTVQKMDEQIKSAQEQERERIKRENEKLHLYARAKFLMHTNLIFNNANEVKKYITETYKGTKNLSLPAPPNFEELFDLNLFLPDNPFSKDIVEILKILQIVYARLPSLASGKVFGMHEGCLSYIFKVEWIYNRMLENAREAEEPISETFLKYLEGKVTFATGAPLPTDTEKSFLAICRVYLDAYKDGRVISL